jgi:hypothetical protein
MASADNAYGIGGGEVWYGFAPTLWTMLTTMLRVFTGV